MADRIEREIEEILARLDDELPADGQPERAPISLASRRKKQATPKTDRARLPRPAVADRITPTTLLFTGAGVMLAGLFLSGIASAFIWLSLAGALIFLGAFAWSFFRRPKPTAAQAPQGYFWRDRYIEYEPANASLASRLKRRFRRH